jgi:hypothetical protein
VLTTHQTLSVSCLGAGLVADSGVKGSYFRSGSRNTGPDLGGADVLRPEAVHDQLRPARLQAIGG